MKERIEFRLIRYTKEGEQDIYSHLRLSTGDWEKDRLIYIKALNKLGEDLNAEEEKG